MLLNRYFRWDRPSGTAWAAPSFSLLLSLWSGSPATAQTGPAAPIPEIAAVAAEPPEPIGPPAARTVEDPAHPVFTVDDCVRIGLERQPTIATARASLIAKQAAVHALDNIRAGGLLAPDLEFRRLQARHGLQAASADLVQAEFDTAYNIARNYFTAVYANSQIANINEVLASLKYYRDRIDERVKAGADENVNELTLDKITIVIQTAEYRKVEAQTGVQKALAALREAMGVGNDCLTFQLADRVLPEPAVFPDRCAVVTAALARRGEVMKALVAADVGRIEIDAQARIVFHRVARTYASGSDIHATPIPTGDRGPNYRPAAVGPEMPVSLAGNRNDRVKQAKAYAERADAVAAKIRELVTLETEEAFLRWQQANQEVKFGKIASGSANSYAQRIRKNVDADLTYSKEDVLTADVIAGQSRGALLDARYREILALIDLERITAGGFVAGLAASPAATYSVESR